MRAWHQAAIHFATSLQRHVMVQIVGLCWIQMESAIRSQPTDLHQMRAAHARYLDSAAAFCLLPPIASWEPAPSDASKGGGQLGSTPSSSLPAPPAVSECAPAIVHAVQCCEAYARVADRIVMWAFGSGESAAPLGPGSEAAPAPPTAGSEDSYAALKVAWLHLSTAISDVMRGLMREQGSGQGGGAVQAGSTAELLAQLNCAYYERLFADSST
eukprot:gene6816-30788_t